MKIVKRILIVIVVLIAIPLVAAIFVKKDYAVQREVIINKPNMEVFEYIKFLRNQDNFSKWASMDPNMTKTYRGTDGTVGFVSAWDSDNKDVGKGEQEILKITEGKRIDYELRFLKPFESTESAYLSTEAVSRRSNQSNLGFQRSYELPDEPDDVIYGLRKNDRR